MNDIGDKPSTDDKEFHSDSDCTYTLRMVWRYDELFYIWIRECECGRETDQSDLLSIEKHELPEYNEDGYEIHTDSECQWKHEGRYGSILVRYCVCNTITEDPGISRGATAEGNWP